MLLITLGWILVVAGAGFFLHFACGDWLRRGGVHLRRCPKCWYDLSHSPGLTCSECGYAAQRERQLHRVRRLNRHLAIAITALAAGYMAIRGPAIKQRGWWAAVPTTAFLLFCEHLEVSAAGQFLPSGATFTSSAMLAPVATPTWRCDAGDELFNERFCGSMWEWQRWILLYRCSRLAPADPSPGQTGFSFAASSAGFSELTSRVMESELNTHIADPTQSAHLRRLWNRALDEVVVTAPSVAPDGTVSVALSGSPWFRSERWRCLLLFVEGREQPVEACLLMPAGDRRRPVTTCRVAVPDDGVLRLRIQLAEPRPPRTRVEFSECTPIWEIAIERRFEP